MKNESRTVSVELLTVVQAKKASWNAFCNHRGNVKFQGGEQICSILERYEVAFDKYLKENEVNQKENKLWASEPKEIIPGLNDGNTLYNMAPFLNCQSHLCYDNMELRSHQ